MYRISDGRQMAKLFIYDSVSFMLADNDFLVLAMNDRRLLTLMIADPDDPTTQEKIQALPSRKIQRTSKSATANFVQHLEKYANFSSSSSESDSFDDDTNLNNKNTTEKSAVPVTLFRFVTRLTGRYSPSKMSNNNELRCKVMTIFSNNRESIDIAQVVDDSDDESPDEIKSSSANMTTIGQQPDVENDLNDIRQRILEHERQQIRGVQFANAGDGNLKVVNNYTITSNTCMLL